MSIDCTTFLDRMSDLLDGRLDGDVRGETERHLEDCPACRELWAMLVDDLAGRPGNTPVGLPEAILEQTTGAPCDSARTRLCAYVDRRLDPVDRELVGGHLDRCEPCRSLELALRRLSVDLPALATVEPDEAFVAAVLEATLPSSPGLPQRIVGWATDWHRVLRRPRLAWEGAYLGTLLLLTSLGLTGISLSDLSDAVEELAATNHVAALAEPATRLETVISEKTRAALRVAGPPLVRTTQEATREIADRSALAMSRLRRDLGTLSERLASELTMVETGSDPGEHEREQEMHDERDRSPKRDE